MKAFINSKKRSNITVFKLFICNLILIALTSVVSADVDAKEGLAIAECLDRFGGPTFEHIQRIQRFKQWSATYEEIPCFTNCYLSKMFDFYDETKGFVGGNVIKKFGSIIYEACKTKLIEGNNKCEIAYNGFHCIVNLESDPFVMIENMKGVNFDGKLAMKDCLHKFDSFEWEKFAEYNSYPVKEPIPCYTRCFVDRLQLFNHRLRKWNARGMQEKFAVSADNKNISVCRAMGKRRTRNSCAWMYKEFICHLMSRNADNVKNKV